MRLMPNIKLTEEQFRKILLHHKIYPGGEATICEGSNYGTVYKLFSENGNPKPMGDNKEKKVIELYHRQLDYSTKPISTISVDDMIVGYEMTTDYDFEAYKLYQLREDELIHFLRQSKTILEYFLSEGIIYGDVEPRNILFDRNTGKVMFCDMDNAQIGNYPIDKMPFNLLGYDAVRGIDSSTPSFAHNHMTLHAFELDAYCTTPYTLRKVFKRPAKRIVKSMNNPSEYTGEYLIDHKKKCK